MSWCEGELTHTIYSQSEVMAGNELRAEEMSSSVGVVTVWDGPPISNTVVPVHRWHANGSQLAVLIREVSLIECPL